MILPESRSLAQTMRDCRSEMEDEVEKNYQKIRVDIANLLFKEQNSAD